MIYLDHHAAAPIDPRVRAAMDAARELAWANPSSAHAAGRAARSVLEHAREQIARAVGAKPADLVLTSGGTEACNLAVLGLLPRPGRVVTTTVEHPAIAEAVNRLEAEGSSVLRLPVPAGASPDPDALAEALEGAGACVVQWVGHETGTLFDVAGYGRACAARGVALVIDATQALGKVPVDLGSLGASAVAFASSKIGGPQGVGALWVRRDRPLDARQLGGSQERGRRAGTPDPVSAAGFGAAAALVGERLAAMPEIASLRDHLERALVAEGAVVNGAEGSRVATCTNVSFRGWRGSSLVAALDLEGLCASHGAACSSGVDEPSAVVGAMHPDEPWRAEGALRLSLGVSTTGDDVDGAIAILARVLARKRA